MGSPPPAVTTPGGNITQTKAANLMRPASNTTLCQTPAAMVLCNLHAIVRLQATGTPNTPMSPAYTITTRSDQAVACYSVQHSLLLLLGLCPGLVSVCSGGGAKVRAPTYGLVLGGSGGSTCYPHAPPPAGSLRGGGGGNCSRTPPPARRSLGGVVGA